MTPTLTTLLDAHPEFRTPDRWSFSWADLPKPPSINNGYLNVPGRGRVKSRELQAFGNHFQAWALENNAMVRDHCQIVKKWTSGGHGLQMHFHFSFPRVKLLTKDGRLKRLDVTNRVKFMEDAVCAMLGVDDTLVIASSQRKGVWARETAGVRVTIQVVENVGAALMGGP